MLICAASQEARAGVIAVGLCGNKSLWMSLVSMSPLVVSPESDEQQLARLALLQPGH